MEVTVTLAVIFSFLMFSVYKGINIIYPLFTCLMAFIIIAYRRGFSPRELFKMILNGVKKSLMIISIILLIGAVTAVWRASGTVAYVVYYCIKFMNPNYFILYAFILTCIVSFLLGTSFGTVGTIGIILMVMVKGGGINTSIVAGAIIAGIFFGDRCSPMSSSANLVAAITDTNIYTNVKNMFVSSVVPFAVSIIIFGILSFLNPLNIGESEISAEIVKAFNLHWALILPALIMLILAVFKVEVRISMLFSIIIGVAVSIIIQKESMADMIRYIFSGYRRVGQGFFDDIIAGGGISSMLEVVVIILISFTLSRVFEEASLLKGAEKILLKLKGKIGMFATMIVTSVIGGSFGCSQTLATMLVYQLTKDMYAADSLDKYEHALDMEDTVIVISPLIPWSIAGAVPAAMLEVNSGYIIFACYLYLLPLFGLISKKTGFPKRYRTP